MALIYGKNTNAVMLLQFEKFWLFSALLHFL